ncbi:c-type cytochrome [Marinobacterium arenosum]|uniref:c-type cytochrome n=1 Tax=Marinobacterium arenosum TaxID=2862496 RepID=UPI001C95387F|nr:cytochrome c [Marinobacterium arenosum]MBY4677575.1 cytochrome c [Marinobacterium arenosum]
MKRLILGVAGAAAAGALVWGGLAFSSIAEPVSIAADQGNVARGAYLARAGGCIACHTDIAGGGKPLAGGAPLDTPFGTFYAPNLTQDPQQGIGNWTLEDFARALRQGVSPEGEPYYPAFPYSFYTRLSDQDIADLWAAFRTVPAVAQPSREQQLEFPFNIRSGLRLWQQLYLERQRFQPSADADQRFNRGAYLVEGAAHCAACHTPRNLLGGLDPDAAFQGASGLPDGGSAPAITAAALQANGWTVEDLAYALKSGITPDGDVLGGTMGEVIRDGTSFLSQADREAIAHYLLNNRS